MSTQPDFERLVEDEQEMVRAEQRSKKEGRIRHRLFCSGR